VSDTLSAAVSIGFHGIAFAMVLYLISVGLSVTMGMMGFVNLAHGVFAMLGGYVLTSLMNRLGVPFALALAGAAVATAIASVAVNPVVVMTVMPNGTMSMARNLVLWFLYCVVIGLFAAYIAGRALPPGTPYLRVFQMVGAAAFAGYVLALWKMSIWYHRAWSTTIKTSIDGLIYALLTAGTFGWLWPH